MIFGRLALHTWTLDSTPLPVTLDAAAEAGFDAVELRLLDFWRCHQQGISHSVVIETIRRSGLAVAVVGVEPGWIFATGDESRRLFDAFKRYCEKAAALGCDTLMSSPGRHVGTVEQAMANMRRAGELAAGFNLRLALEFSATHPVINTLAVQREIVAGVDLPNCGLLLDAYHLERSGAGGRGFASVPVDDIFVFQYSDVPDQPMAPATEAPIDRLPPGQGVVDWIAVLGLLAEKGYAGYLSYEAPNPAQWARSPYDVAAEAVTETRRLLQDAGRRT